MNLTQAVKDPEVRDLIQIMYRHKGFDRLRIAFTSHSPNGDDKIEVSTAVAHGQNLGTRYVFNKIEEYATQPPTQTNKPKRESGGKDPDLS